MPNRSESSIRVKEHRLGLGKSEETISKQNSEGMFGEDNPAYIDGNGYAPYPIEFQKIKSKIRKRDNYECQLCGINEKECKQNLHIHHVDYDKNNCLLNNLIGLCSSCHLTTNLSRRFWEITLSNILLKRSIE